MGKCNFGCVTVQRMGLQRWLVNAAARDYVLERSKFCAKEDMQKPQDKVDLAFLVTESLSFHFYFPKKEMSTQPAHVSCFLHIGTPISPPGLQRRSVDVPESKARLV